MAERLLGWTDESLREDLRAYSNVDPSDAVSMRDRLLSMLQGEGER